jgi:predicted RNA-binding Zn ribbon-like protein
MHTHTTPQPGSRAPAPGELSLVQEFVNTRDIEQDRDDLVKPDDLREFLTGHGLLRSKKTLDESDLARARTVREAIRALLTYNTGEDLDRSAVETLNRESSGAKLVVRFRKDGTSTLEPDVDGIEAALGRIIAIVFASMAEGSWTRLKACSRHSCQWAFYDQSKNGSSRWCSMRICGNREKADSYRRRHR